MNDNRIVKIKTLINLFVLLNFLTLLSCAKSAESEDGPIVTETSSEISINNILEPVDGQYGEGASLIFQVNYAAVVTVVGTPRIALDVGGSLAYAEYFQGSGTSGIEFVYTISSGENDNDGIALATTSIDLNGGSIEGSGIEAQLSITKEIDSLTNILVNTTQLPPDQVTGVSTAPSTSGDDLQSSWSVPNDNGNAIVNYIVQYREEGEANWITHSPSSTGPQVTIAGLSAGVRYELRVAANNGVVGPYSAISTAEIFDISSLDPIAWLSATDITNGGGQPSDGDRVATWSDLTGVASDATESNVSDQPIYREAVQNGLGAVEFDGTQTQGLEGTFTRVNNGGLTVLLVGQFNFISPRRAMFEFYQDGSPGSGVDSRRGFFFSYGFNEASTSMGLADGSFQIWSAYDDGSYTDLWQDGVSMYTDNPNHFGRTDFTGLGRYILGDDMTGGDRLEGYLGELLIFDRELTSDELSTLETYLKNKWGI